MAHEFHILLTDEQHRWLERESSRTSVSASELIRRALDRTYRIAVSGSPARPSVLELRLTVWTRRVFGRRAGIPFGVQPSSARHRESLRSD